MELGEAIRGRRATRGYTAEPVDRAAIAQLIEAAVHAPSAMNAQPWDFCVIEGRARLQAISEAAAAHMAALVRQGELAGLHHGNLDSPHFDVLYHAPALVVISTQAGPWAAENAALAAENLMLAAHAIGLGSCWIGLAQRWLETDEGKAAIECPPGFVPVAPIILGHPSASAPQAARRAPRVRWLA